MSQELLVDSIDYQSYVVINENNNVLTSELSNATFKMRGDVIFTNLGGQRRAFYLLESWEDTDLGHGVPVKIAYARDAGGFRLSITVGYQYSSGVYFVILAYNNTSFFYEVTKSEVEKPYDELFIYKEEVPDYTKEEIYNFLRKYGDPDVLMNVIIYQLWDI